MDFYYLPGSAPCRAVQMTAKAVGVDLNLKLLDLFKGEHLKPEFLQVSELFLSLLFDLIRCIVDNIELKLQSFEFCFMAFFFVLW